MMTEVFFLGELTLKIYIKTTTKQLGGKRGPEHIGEFCAFLITWKYMPPSLKIEIYN